jgi:hypothetical protein
MFHIVVYDLSPSLSLSLSAQKMLINNNSKRIVKTSFYYFTPQKEEIKTILNIVNRGAKQNKRRIGF